MQRPREPRPSSPVPRYAAIVAVLVFAAIVIGVVVGRRAENPAPSGPVSSPIPNASVGPTPRY